MRFVAHCFWLILLSCPLVTHAEMLLLGAAHIEYNREQNLISAQDVSITGPNDEQLFAKTAELDMVSLTGGFTDLDMSVVPVDPNNSRPRLTARTAARTDSETIILEDMSYTPCPTCEEDPTPAWTISADKVKYSTERQMVSYRGAVLRANDIPVMYLPYLRHAVGKRRPVSGILPPQFGRNTNRGEELRLAGYISHSEHRDTTIRANIMTQRGLLVQPEHRWYGLQSRGELKAGGLHDRQETRFRSSLSAKAEYWRSAGQRIGINTQLVSDETYLDDFFNDTPSYLPSTIYAEHASNQHYLAAYSTYYHDLREGQDPATTAQVLPRIQFERWWNFGLPGGQISTNLDFLSIYRDAGEKPRRLIANANITQPYWLESGDLITAELDIRGDIYQIDSTSQDSSSGRLLPTASLGWERALISPDTHHEIIPQLKLIAAPAGGNPDDIPNLDSVAYELDTTNLFMENRFAGLDRVETGTRLVYGLNQRWTTEDHRRWLEVFLGQSYRFNEDTSLPALGGTQTKGSDWVGNIVYQPYENLTFDNRFRLDNSDFSARRLDSSLLWGDVHDNHLRFAYTFLDGGAEEARIWTRYDLTDAWSVRTQFRRDLTEDGKLLLSEGEVVYSHPCYRIGLVARRTGYSNRTVTAATEVMINFELLTLGEGRVDD